VKSIVFICATIALTLIATCLSAQDVSELDRRNGFKSIKLGSLIDSVKEAVFKKDIIELEAYPAKLYETKHADYTSIGEVEVKKVQLKTYKGLIYEIHVYLPKDARVMQGLEKSYGAATYSMRLHAYYWNGESLSLVFKGEGKHIHLTYKSAPIIKMMHEDKNKKVEQVAEEF
jgi:hypothetical protein